MLSIERLAMIIRGRTKEGAEYQLDRFGFSPSEIAEITTQSEINKTGILTASVFDISQNIKSTMQCSIRIGTRNNMSV